MPGLAREMQFQFGLFLILLAVMLSREHGSTAEFSTLFTEGNYRYLTSIGM